MNREFMISGFLVPRRPALSKSTQGTDPQSKCIDLRITGKTVLFIVMGSLFFLSLRSNPPATSSAVPLRSDTPPSVAYQNT